MIEVSNLTIQKGARKILKDLNFKVNPGEILAVLGANGAGKSTLLRAIGGEETPKEGTILLNGRSLNDWTARRLARMRGILSQKVELSFALSVLEVVLMGRYAHANLESKEESLAIAKWCLRQVDIESMQHRNILTLSGGEQQRVHLARVLAQVYCRQARHTRFLLLDEPLASLDLAHQHRLLHLLVRLCRKEGFGIFIVIHDMNLAAQYADRILLLNRGEILANGSPAQVFTGANIQKAYGIRAVIMQNPVYQCPQITAFHEIPNATLQNGNTV